MKNVIKIKYTIISFIIGLIPFIIVSSILNNNPKYKLIHSTTLLMFGLSTALANSIYTYVSINNKLQNKTHQ